MICLLPVSTVTAYLLLSYHKIASCLNNEIRYWSVAVSQATLSIPHHQLFSVSAHNTESNWCCRTETVWLVRLDQQVKRTSWPSPHAVDHFPVHAWVWRCDQQKTTQLLPTSLRFIPRPGPITFGLQTERKAGPIWRNAHPMHVSPHLSACTTVGIHTNCDPSSLPHYFCTMHTVSSSAQLYTMHTLCPNCSSAQLCKIFALRQGIPVQ